jgi:glutathione synthase/RimK-type ligase-like ATP-grasp enzyme
MKKIIALTVQDDLHTNKIAKILQERYDEELIELSRETYGKEWQTSIIAKKTGFKIHFEHKGVEFSNKDVRSMWLRRNFHFASSHDNASPQESYIASQTAIHVNSTIRLLAESTFCINSPEANWRANSKALQASYAIACGLKIPETFQGGQPNLLHEFSEETTKNFPLCIKPIESAHLKIDANTTLAHYTRIFNRRPLEELDSVRMCPVTIQKYIEKDYEIRATVVGEKIFAALIDTKNASPEAKIDFRHYDWANTPYYPLELPETVNKKILRLMRRLKLNYGAIDLIKTADNEYYFLEVNAQGQWLWVEDMTGLKISDAIAMKLLSAA